MNLTKKILSFTLLVMLVSCNSLKVQKDYCEIAFAYPVDQPLPDQLERGRIGCACTSKDILRGVEVGSWVLKPLESCRRLRGFHPKQWKLLIDPYFQRQTKRVFKKRNKMLLKRLIKE